MLGPSPRRLAAAVPLSVFLTAALALGATRDDDLAAARALFETNLDAIRERDRDAYLACYLESESLARTGPEGIALGYAALAESAGEGWPDVFEGRDLQLVSVQDGVVYGTYRYRVVYGDSEHSGISERFFVRTADGWRIAVTTAFEAPPGTPPPPLALVGATLLDGTGAAAVPDSVVLLRGGRIECAGARRDCPLPDGPSVVDVAGKWITPGLIDAHVHFSQTGWADGRPDALDVTAEHPYEQVQATLRADPERWFRSYLCSGVTAVLDAGGYPWTWGLAGREPDTRAPRVQAAGPLLSTLDHPLNLLGEKQLLYVPDEDTARRGVRYLAAHGAAAAKVWFVKDPERSFDAMAAAVLAAGDEARRRELPLIVHATGLREAKVAVRAGAHLLVHSVWDDPVDDEFLALAREAGTIYCPTLMVPAGYLRMYESVASGEPWAGDDPNGCVDGVTWGRRDETARLGRGRVEAGRIERRRARQAKVASNAARNLVRVHAAGIPIAMGTDAGNPFTFHGASVHAEMEAMQAAGLTPHDVLIASTRGGAMALGRLDELGTLESGKAADLLIIDADPAADIANLRKIHGVVRGGVLRPAAELRVRK